VVDKSSIFLYRYELAILCRSLGIRVITAESEADQLIASLCILKYDILGSYASNF
jgi:hypothetical protein